MINLSWNGGGGGTARENEYIETSHGARTVRATPSRACPTNTTVRGTLFWTLLFAGHGGGGVDMTSDRSARPVLLHLPSPAPQPLPGVCGILGGLQQAQGPCVKGPKKRV